MRRLLLILWISLSVLMIGFTSYGILNTSVSYKYEVEDVLNPSEEALNKEKYLESTLLELKILLAFLIVNLGIGSYLIFKNSKPQENLNVV